MDLTTHASIFPCLTEQKQHNQRFLDYQGQGYDLTRFSEESSYQVTIGRACKTTTDPERNDWKK